MFIEIRALLLLRAAPFVALILFGVGSLSTVQKLFTYGEGFAVVYCLLRNGLVLRAVANGNALTVGNRKYTIKNRQLLIDMLQIQF